MNIIFNILSIITGCYILFYSDSFVIFILGQKIDIWFLIVPIIFSVILIFVKDFFIKKLGLFGNFLITSLNFLISFFIGGLAFKVAASYMVFREKIINNSFFLLKRIKWTEEEYLERARFFLWTREGTESLNLKELYKELKPNSMEEWDLQLQIIVKKIQDDLLEKKLKLLEAKLHNLDNQLSVLNNKSVVDKGWMDTLVYDYLFDPKIWVVVGLLGLGYAVYSGVFASKVSSDVGSVEPTVTDKVSEVTDKVSEVTDKVSVNASKNISESIPIEKGVLTVDTRLDILESEYDNLLDSIKHLTEENQKMRTFEAATKIRYGVLYKKMQFVATQIGDLFVGANFDMELKIKRLNMLKNTFHEDPELGERISGRVANLLKEMMKESTTDQVKDKIGSIDKK